MSIEPLAAEVAIPLIPGVLRPKSAGPSTIGTPTIEKEPRAEEELDLPWHVVVHNDPVNLMSYVTMVFQRVFGYPRDRAERHMLSQLSRHQLSWTRCLATASKNSSSAMFFQIISRIPVGSVPKRAAFGI